MVGWREEDWGQTLSREDLDRIKLDKVSIRQRLITDHQKA